MSHAARACVLCLAQEAGHDAPHFCTDPLMATLAHFDTDQARLVIEVGSEDIDLGVEGRA